MIKSEQLRDSDQFKRVMSTTTAVSLPPLPPMFQTTSIIVPKRSVDPRAIDISSVKGRFAWEKIPMSDTYMPVIFRGTTKYFCIKMLRKLLPEYPEDIIRCPSYFQYQKAIDFYIATPHELELLNRINAHHSHWTYSRQPMTVQDELVRVMDFLPFFDHLRSYCKPGPIPRTASTNGSRPILPQSQQNMQRSPDVLINKSTAVGKQWTINGGQIQPYPASELPRENNSSASRLMPPASSTPRPSRQPKYDAHTLEPPPPYGSLHQRQPLTPSLAQQLIPSEIVNSTSIVLPNTHSTVSLTTSVPVPSTSQPATTLMAITSSSPNAVISSPTATSSRKLSITSPQKQSTPIFKQPSSSSSSSSTSISTSPDIHSGWLQINKLYTPFISTTVSNRHLYKIPVSLLTFYELLKIPSIENNPNESKDTSSSSSLFEQIPVTPQEIELVNELCLKQNIKPFSIDTKLITLTIFYQYSSATILFIKELPLNDPKASICKDWSSIVQINGGICRLRNVTTLHEQTVPFIGNNLLKNFIISSQCLASASLSSPTAAEIEFLQLILFFSNMSINLRSAKLIDIESVQKEYNVDLILLFNDKFPLNVLNYQQQGNRASTSQGQIIQSNSSAAANTFAESTPPPSPPSPPNNQPKTTHNITVNPSSQLSLTSSASSANRYQKTITFHGHPMTAYICSGLGSNAQRECISVKALCKILYPNSTILDKLESKMLRFLRLKSINRFRPQNQQSMGFTRLIDVKDAEKHWDYIEEEMRSVSNNDEDKIVVSAVNSSLSDTDSQASTLNKVGDISKTVEQELSISETSIDVTKGVKRVLNESVSIRLEEEDLPVLERIDKRIRISEQDGRENPTPIRFHSITTTKDEYDHSDSDESVDDDGEKIRCERDNNESKNQPATIKQLPIITFRRHTDVKMAEKYKQQNEKTSSNSLALSQKRILSTKKKIRLIRKRTTPRTRTNKQSKAAWVEKYNIEECCIRLDLYDPAHKTGKN